MDTVPSTPPDVFVTMPAVLRDVSVIEAAVRPLLTTILPLGNDTAAMVYPEPLVTFSHVLDAVNASLSALKSSSAPLAPEKESHIFWSAAPPETNHLKPFADDVTEPEAESVVNDPAAGVVLPMAGGAAKLAVANVPKPKLLRAVVALATSDRLFALVSALASVEAALEADVDAEEALDAALVALVDADDALPEAAEALEDADEADPEAAEALEAALVALVDAALAELLAALADEAALVALKAAAL